MINDTNLHKQLLQDNAVREHTQPPDKFGVHFDYEDLCKRLKKIKSERNGGSTARSSKKRESLKSEAKPKSRKVLKTKNITKYSSKSDLKPKSRISASNKSSSNLLSVRSKSRMRSEVNLKVSPSVKKLKLKANSRIDLRIAKVYLNNISIPVTKRKRKSTKSQEIPATSSRRTKSNH